MVEITYKYMIVVVFETYVHVTTPARPQPESITAS